VQNTRQHFFHWFGNSSKDCIFAPQFENIY
jgi:hypothetical protein